VTTNRPPVPVELAAQIKSLTDDLNETNQIAADRAALMAQARDLGCSWQAIADVAGITREAARSSTVRHGQALEPA
jgi:hypothetical protein